MPRSTQNHAGKPNTPRASSAELNTDAIQAVVQNVFEKLVAEGLIAAPSHVSSATPKPGIFADYLTPAALAAELNIREAQLADRKRDGFGPPRTHLRQHVMYRRKAVLRWLCSLEEDTTAAVNDSPRAVAALELNPTLVQPARPPPSKTSV